MANYYLGGKFKQTSQWGMRRHPIKGVAKMHNGVDLAAPAGTKIPAIMGGTVITNNFQRGGAGNYIKIRHDDGTTSTYMHMLNRSPLKVGQRVNAGQIIGLVGSTGGSTGNHLHLELRDSKGRSFNPVPYLKNMSKGASTQQRNSFKGFTSPNYSQKTPRLQASALRSAPKAIQGFIQQASKTYGVRSELIAAIMKTESGFRTNARSSVGATGLMQLMPQYHGHKGNIRDPKTNTLIGTQYLKTLLRTFPDVRLALAAYNSGDGRVKNLMKKHGSSWDKIAKYLPKETRNYVPKVLSYI